MSDKQSQQKQNIDDKALAKIGALADLRHIEGVRTELKAMMSWQEKWGFLLPPKSEKQEEDDNAALLNETPFSLTVSSKTPYLLPEDEKMKVDIEGIEGEIDPHKEIDLTGVDLDDPKQLKAACLFIHEEKKLQELAGIPNDKYYFPPTTSSQYGWWAVEAAKKIEEDTQHSDATSRNTLLDSYLRRLKFSSIN